MQLYEYDLERWRSAIGWSKAEAAVFLGLELETYIGLEALSPPYISKELLGRCSAVQYLFDERGREEKKRALLTRTLYIPLLLLFAALGLILYLLPR